MATILTHPDSLSLSSNLKRFEIAASSEVRFILSQGSAVIIDESYYPNPEGRIIIDVREVINGYLSTAIPTSNIFQQAGVMKTFSADINSEVITFVAIKSGVENLAETPGNFLTANWLTWQPQSKKVTYNQPEWLTYYAVVNAVVKVKLYLKNDTSVVQTLHNISAGTCYSYNLQFAYVMTLVAGDKYGYYDVWVENTSGTRLTYIQRYVYRQQESNDEYFLFINSLGGVDTANLTGESRFSPEVEHREGLYDDVSVQTPGAAVRRFEKNSGWMAKNEVEWLFDLLKSQSKYKLHDGTFKLITISESSVEDTSLEDMKSIALTYRMANDSGLLNIARSMDPLPENLEIDTPEDGLFFLAPRLVDFDSAEPDDSFLFPIQSPFLQKWFKFSWGALWNFLYNKLIDSAIGVMSHVHDNFLVIGDLSDVNGKLKYKGEDIAPAAGLGVALGETSQTAYRGDRGKIAYDHTLNTASHFSSSAQKLKLTEIANDYHTLADPALDGLLIQTLIPTSVASDYINIEISGFGKIGSAPFAWSGQIYYTSGNFASAAIASVGRGETLDVRIFIRDGFICLWVHGRVKSILNFFNLKLSVCYGADLANLIDTITDAPYPAAGLTAEVAFKDHPETFLRGIPAADQLRIDRAVIASDATQYKFWVGTAPDYAAISVKDPNTFYYIT